MSKIFLTGDTHIPIDVSKLDIVNFPEQNDLTRNDYVIVLGDFGLLWHNNDRYLQWKDWFEHRNFTTLWLDGNHENHDWIDSLPVSKWKGGKVHRISDNIIHLMRGQIFTINQHTFFVYGGAQSNDMERREIGISWWAREQGNFQEEYEAINNLALYNNKVDYILTHTCPQFISKEYFGFTDITVTGKFLNYIAETVTFNEWYFGHIHKDRDMGNYHAIFQTIRQLMN